jgi:hypothetical protein
MRLLTIVLFIPYLFFPQKAVEPEKIKAFNITVNYEDYTVKTQMLKDQPKKASVNNELAYMWYSSNKIIETKGGFDGKLIHGFYKSFYLNNQLRESGQVNYGLKNKEWKNWYPDGKLKEVITYKKGKKTGKYILYNDYGKLMAKGNFKDDLLNGKFYTYDNMGRVSETKKYKNGTEVIPVPKKKKLKKEKKTKDTTDTDIVIKKKKTFGQRIKGWFKRENKKQKKSAKETSEKSTTA